MKVFFMHYIIIIIKLYIIINVHSLNHLVTFSNCLVEMSRDRLVDSKRFQLVEKEHALLGFLFDGFCIDVPF